MCAHGDGMLLAGANCVGHDQGVTAWVSGGQLIALGGLPGVESTCDVCMVNEWDECFIRTADIVTVRLAQINIDIDGVLNRRHGEDSNRVSWC